MQISKALGAKLNEQVTAEFLAAQSYLAMACQLDAMGLKILGKRFLEQCAEEREHAERIIRYLLEGGAEVRLEAIPKPKAGFPDARSIIAAAVDSEKAITARINDLVALADSEKDYATRSFLNWFVDEQVEEISSMTDLLNLVELAAGNMLQVENRVRHDMTAQNGS